jgi:hypothetical protein
MCKVETLVLNDWIEWLGLNEGEENEGAVF